MKARDAIARAFEGVDAALSADDVIARVRTLPEGDRWKDSTLRTVLRALAPNTGASHHYPSERRHGFLFAVGADRFRHWDVATDGPLDKARVATPAQPTARPAKVHQTVTVPERAAVVRRLVDELHYDPFQPQYRKKAQGDRVTGWPSRLRAYFWPHPVMDLRATTETLTPWFDEAGALSRRLLDGAPWDPDKRRRAAVLAWLMLTWGGVTQQSGFSEETVESVFRRALGLCSDETAPMNSGWTKVAAMATAFLEGESDRAPHVIWDSRVSTSIVWRLDRMLSELDDSVHRELFPQLGVVAGRVGSGTRPRRLQLRWAYPYGRWWGQDAGSAMVRDVRDVLNEGQYGWMPLPDGGEGKWTIRGVESVLFMDGY